MDIAHAINHVRAVNLAIECAKLGARLTTIHWITGLQRRMLAQLFIVVGPNAARGRLPSMPDWFHTSNLIDQVDASCCMAIYTRFRELGFPPSVALVAGYKHYRHQCDQAGRLNFDRAFDLVCHTDGLWKYKKAHLALHRCPRCGSSYLANVGLVVTHSGECLFCRLVRRYPFDVRLQNGFTRQYGAAAELATRPLLRP